MNSAVVFLFKMNAEILFVVLLGMLAYVQARITVADVRAAEWESFKVEFNKNYEDEWEDRRHMQKFQDNKRIIDEHNKRFEAGEVRYEMGVNEFTDLFDEEFNNLFPVHDASVMDAEEEFDSGEDETEHDSDEDASEEDNTDIDNMPRDRDVDWRKIGAVTPVLNQGHFNTSWAFAAAGVVESRQFVKTGKLVTLSKQNLVDCCRSKHHGVRNALRCIKRKVASILKPRIPTEVYLVNVHSTRSLSGQRFARSFIVIPAMKGIWLTTLPMVQLPPQFLKMPFVSIREVYSTTLSAARSRPLVCLLSVMDFAKIVVNTGY